uniref:rho guanine nucleotide exchange factor 28-like n=1 Tax=Myxine glutinosa TaxID=7769 RepID=UPI00358F568E
MDCSPEEVPIYGEVLVTVTLRDGSLPADDLFFVLQGSEQRHVLTAERRGEHCAFTVVPGHHRCETVALSLYVCTTTFETQYLGTTSLCYFEDTLCSAIPGLLGAAFGNGQIPDWSIILHEPDLQDPDKLQWLDRRLAAAIGHLAGTWDVTNLLDCPATEEDLQIPHDSPLHVAAQRGLSRFAATLLTFPASRKDLTRPGVDGLTPAEIAQRQSHMDLQILLDRKPTELASCLHFNWESKNVGDGWTLRRHPESNTLLLTRRMGTPGRKEITVLEDVKLLQSTSQEHIIRKNGPLSRSISQDTVQVRMSNVDGEVDDGRWRLADTKRSSSVDSPRRVEHDLRKEGEEPFVENTDPLALSSSKRAFEDEMDPEQTCFPFNEELNSSRPKLLDQPAPSLDTLDTGGHYSDIIAAPVVCVSPETSASAQEIYINRMVVSEVCLEPEAEDMVVKDIDLDSSLLSTTDIPTGGSDSTHKSSPTKDLDNVVLQPSIEENLVSDTIDLVEDEDDDERAQEDEEEFPESGPESDEDDRNTFADTQKPRSSVIRTSFRSNLPSHRSTLKSTNKYRHASNSWVEGQRVASFSRSSLTLPLTLHEDGAELYVRKSEQEKNARLTPLLLPSPGCDKSSRVGRTFSFIRTRLGSNKSRSKQPKNKETKDDVNGGHHFNSATFSSQTNCSYCDRSLGSKDAYQCVECNVNVHKNCVENLPTCYKVKSKSNQSPYPPGKDFIPSHLAFSTRYNTLNGGTMYSQGSCVASQVSSTPLHHSFQRNIPTNRLLQLEEMDSVLGSPSGGPMVTKVECSQEEGPLSHDYNHHYANTENCSMDSHPVMTIPSEELEGFEEASWSSTVSASFFQQQENSQVKRQDIIYELMQTEMHHVHTLHVMGDIFADGICNLPGFDEGTVERLFPCQRELEEAHDAFMRQLYERWRCCLEEYGGGPNYIIHRIGDILVQQFSDTSAKTLIDIYGEFCSRHKEALDFYKALMLRKPFQSFINKQSQNPMLRRKGVQECMLLVTQRITKYPTLLGELLKHTKDDTEEHADISKSLVLIKNIITAVDECVHKRQTLIDFARRTDSKVQCRTKDGRVFKHANLLALRRRLLYDGNFNCRVSSGRIKDVHVLLMSDVIVFLQEKDQKYVFPSMLQKAPVISLHKMLVREVANEERAMFLISAAAHAEIYELHSQSKKERIIWMERIRQAVESCPEQNMIMPAYVEDSRLEKHKEFQERLADYDQKILSIVEEKLKIYGEITGSAEVFNEARALLNSDGSDPSKCGPILQHMTREVLELEAMMFNGRGCLARHNSTVSCPPYPVSSPPLLPQRADTFSGFDNSPPVLDFEAVDNRKLSWTPTTDPQLIEPPMEFSDKDYHKGGSQRQNSENSEHWLHELEMIQHTYNLKGHLDCLKVAVERQESCLELQQQQQQEREQSSRAVRPTILFWSMKKHATCTEKDEEFQLKLEQLRKNEEAFRRNHEQLVLEREKLRQDLEAYQKDLERLRESNIKLAKERQRYESMFPQRVDPPTSSSSDIVAVPGPKTSTIPRSTSSVSDISGSKSSADFTSDVGSRKSEVRASGHYLPPRIPTNLISTTNQPLLPSIASQQMSNKLLQLSTKSKEKERVGKDKSRNRKEQPVGPSSRPSQATLPSYAECKQGTYSQPVHHDEATAPRRYHPTQHKVRGDSIKVWCDSIKVWGDSIKVWGDSIKVWGDSIKVWGDSIKVWGDSIKFIAFINPTDFFFCCFYPQGGSQRQNSENSEHWLHELEMIQHTYNLKGHLDCLKVAVERQESCLELQQQQQQEREQSSRAVRPTDSFLEHEKTRNLLRQREDLSIVQRQEAELQQHREAFLKEQTEKDEEFQLKLEQLRKNEEAFRRNHEQLVLEREKLRQDLEAYQKDLERLRESNIKLAKERQRYESMFPQRVDPPTSSSSDIVAVPGPKTSTIPRSTSSVSDISGSKSSADFTSDVGSRKSEVRASGHYLPPRIPTNLISTTNQPLLPSIASQQMSNKLLQLSTKSKEKERVGKDKSRNRKEQPVGPSSRPSQATLPSYAECKQGTYSQPVHHDEGYSTKTLPPYTAQEPPHHSLPISQDPPLSVEQGRQQVPIQRDGSHKALALPAASLQHHDSSPNQNDSCVVTNHTVIPQNCPVVPTPAPDPTPNEEVFFC